MSGVMIKTGVYGILRTTAALGELPALRTAGYILLAAGILTGLWGVVLAAAQNDVKRLLAYSSIENVGVILIGIGIAALGKASGNQFVALAGIAGALLHTANHSFFQAAPLLRRGQHPLGDAHHLARQPRRTGPPHAPDGAAFPRRHGGHLRPAAPERLRLGAAHLPRTVRRHRLGQRHPRLGGRADGAGPHRRRGGAGLHQSSTARCSSARPARTRWPKPPRPTTTASPPWRCHWRASSSSGCSPARPWPP